MTPTRRRLLKVALVAVVLFLAAVVAAWIWLDAIARIGVEKAGTAAMGVPTRLASLALRPFAGRCELKGLNVANPPGYDTAHFLDLKTGRVAVNPASLLQDKIVIPELTLSGIDLYLEKKDGRANYQVILDNLKAAQGAAQPSGDATAKGGKRFVINRIVIENVSVHADLLPIGGKITRVNLDLPRIELTDVGQDTPNGVLLSQVSGEVTRAILQGVAAKGGGILPADITQGLSEGLGGLGALGKQTTDAVLNVAKDLGKTAGEIGKGVGEVGKELGKGLGGLLGGSKDKPKEKAPAPGDSPAPSR